MLVNHRLDAIKNLLSSWIFWFIISAGYYCYLMVNGLFLSDDSFNYLSAADSFRQGMGFLCHDDTFYTWWPPLFPIIISAMGTYTQVLLPTLHLMVLAWILYLSSRIVKNTIQNTFLKITLMFLLSLGVQTGIMVVFLWSELIFYYLLLQLLMCFQKYLQEKSNRHLIFSILAGNLLLLQRYAGVFVLLSLIIFLFFWEKENWMFRLRTVLWISLSFTGFAIWRWYLWMYIPSEYQVSELLTAEGFFKAIYWHLSNLGYALLPFSRPGTASLLVGLLIFSYLVHIFLKKSTPTLLRISAMVINCYLLFFCLLNPQDFGEFDRYQAPVMGLVWIIIWYGLDKLKGRKISSMVMIGLSLWLGYPLARVWNNFNYWKERKENTKEEYLKLNHRYSSHFFLKQNRLNLHRIKKSHS